MLSKTCILIAFYITTCSGLMEFDYFTKNILPACYLRNERNQELINGQTMPMPNSMEAFVALVEKIEDLHPQWSLETVIKTLLFKFRYDDLDYDPLTRGWRTRGGGKRERVKAVHQMMKTLLKATPDADLKKDELTNDEQCALYHMISHTVNNTFPNEDNTAQGGNTRREERLWEQGVVSLSSETRHAFALGKVLLGLYVGCKGGESLHVASEDALEDLKPGSKVTYDGKRFLVNMLFAVTFGDVFLLMNEERDGVGAPYYNVLPNGYWSEAVCPVHYVLDSDDNTNRNRKTVNYIVTHSLIRGALDGYILGTALPQLVSKLGDRPRLSHILRMYYRSNGIAGAQDLTWCSRRAFFTKYTSNITERAGNYIQLYDIMSETFNPDVNILVNGIMKYMNDKVDKILTQPQDASPICGAASSATSRCETPTDMIAVLDYKTREEQRDMQNEIVGNLSVGFDMSPHWSSISVYTNLKPMAREEMDFIINGSSYSGCGGCAGAHYDPQRSNTESEIEVMKDLNKTLGIWSSGTEELTGVPAKVVLYFNFGNVQNDYQLREAIWEIRRRHRSTRIIAFGSQKNSLSVFVTDDARDIETPKDVSSSYITNLKEEICRVPAQFQYENCYRRSEMYDQNEKYEGHITPGYIQYWSMDPKYFHRSFDITLSFKALSGGHVKVCFAQSYNKILQYKDPKGTCRETTDAEPVINFYTDNPCHRKTVEQCEPFYFYIEGKSVTHYDSKLSCQDKRCKTPEQISFEFSHQGIACNGATTCTKLTLFITILIAALHLIKGL